MPAPKNNQNAIQAGLYMRYPSHKHIIPADAGLETLGDAADVLATYSMWLASELDNVQEPQLAGQAIVLYASVAHECRQLAAEIEGNGIKISPLGALTNDSYHRLQKSHAESLSLTLSQIATAIKRIRDMQEVEGNGLVVTIPENKRTGEAAQRFINPTLGYMAGMMRSAKRMIATMAANRKWYDLREVGEDLAARIMQEIVGREN